jgi:hypothetical protein
MLPLLQAHIHIHNFSFRCEKGFFRSLNFFPSFHVSDEIFSKVTYGLKLHCIVVYCLFSERSADALFSINYRLNEFIDSRICLDKRIILWWNLRFFYKMSILISSSVKLKSFT